MTTTPGSAELNAVLRADLNAFVQKVFHAVAPGDAFLPNWHIEAIAYQLTRCRDGQTRRLVITQPPRSLKSICTSVAFVAWVLGHDPARRFIVVSYADRLAEDLAGKFRLVVESAWYRALFPRLRAAKSTALELRTTAGGGRIATTIGGSLTGRGADFIIIDDPLKAEDAMSEAARRRVIEWYGSTLVSRLDSQKRGVIILVMQRLHQDDLAGYLLERGGWRHLDLPAIALEDQEIELDPIDVHRRRADEVLHPEREPRQLLERIKAEIGSLRFSAQYQQRPVPLEGNLVRRDWLKSYDTPPEQQKGGQVIQSWDIATATGEANDYSVCTTWLVRKKDYYLLHVLRARHQYPELKRKIVEMAQSHGAKRILIEKAGTGQALVQDLQRDRTPGVPRPIGVTPDGDKIVRMEAASAPIEAGQVHLPKDAPWLGLFLEELLAFPNGRHDDQVDSLSQFLGWIAKGQNSRSLGPPVGGYLIPLEDPLPPYHY